MIDPNAIVVLHGRVESNWGSRHGHFDLRAFDIQNLEIVRNIKAGVVSRIFVLWHVQNGKLGPL